ncbi:MAG: sensor histidine kinase [Burkholderiaceae bacterium]
MTARARYFLLLLTVLALLTGVLAWQRLDDARGQIAAQSALAQRLTSARLQSIAGTNPRDRVVASLPPLEPIPGLAVVVRSPDGVELARQAPAGDTGGRAPDWFRAWVAMPTPAVQARLGERSVVIEVDPIGPLLDQWQAFGYLLLTVIPISLLILVLMWIGLGRLHAPVARLGSAMRDFGRGAHDTRLPALRGREAQALADTFNRMAAGVQEACVVAESRAALAAEQRVSAALTHAMHEREQAQRLDFARDLQVELGQHLTAIRSMGQSIARRVDDPTAPIAQAADLIVTSVDRIDASSRAIIERLRPTELDGVTLPDALAALVADLRRAHPQRQFTLRLAPGTESVDASAATVSYRVAQEALTNALRHSGASVIALNLRLQDDSLVLQIDDNGRGIDPQGASREGHGMAGMREHAASAGGRIDLARSRQGGVTVRLTLPTNGREAGSGPDQGARTGGDRESGAGGVDRAAA